MGPPYYYKSLTSTSLLGDWPATLETAGLLPDPIIAVHFANFFDLCPDGVEALSARSTPRQLEICVSRPQGDPPFSGLFL